MAEADVAAFFQPYLKLRSPADLLDPLLRAWIASSTPAPPDVQWLEAFARDVSGSWAVAADEAEVPAALPRLENGAVVLCAATRAALAAIHGSGIWRADLDERLRYAAVYLLNQNGEGGVACSVACTDGLIRVLRKHPAGHEAPMTRLAAMGPQAWLHGAQFVTEIQGGSDAGANSVRAQPRGDGTYGLHGQKWFCSNLTADLWLVTARPAGAPAGPKGVGLFLVEREGGGFTVERLKDKLGTRALPTAEIMFHGAVGRPVGPLGEGLKTMVAEVLVPSRIHNILAVAGFLRRGHREAVAYGNTRGAFGKPIVEQPLIADSIERLAVAADRAEAGAFATVDAWLAASAAGASVEQVLLARIVVSLHKAIATRRLHALLQEAMAAFGGNGIEERFSVLPRLYRDAAILETWEGPYTLLLMQALSDLRRGGVAGRERPFIATWLGRPDANLAHELAVVLDADEEAAAALWPPLAHALIEAWEARALASLSGAARS